MLRGVALHTCSQPSASHGSGLMRALLPHCITAVMRLSHLHREADYDEEDDYAGYGEEEDVGQQGLQPTKEDPGLFMVTCR